MSVRAYNLHGVHVHVVAADQALAEAIHGRLRHFAAPLGPSPSLSIETHIARANEAHVIQRPPGPARPVYDTPLGEVAYFTAADALWIEIEDRVRVVLQDGRVRASIRETALGETWLLSRPLLTLPLIEALKRRGLYSLHAAAVACDGRALLLPAPSGSGKSTLSVALARSGLSFMADDLVFVSRSPAGLCVHGFPDELDLTAEAAAWFPELGVPPGSPPDGWPKHRVATDRLAGGVTLLARPGALVFPAISPSSSTVMRPMTEDRALVDLAPNVLLTDPAASQAHLDALAELVRAVPSFELAVARDLDHASAVARSALSR